MPQETFTAGQTLTAAEMNVIMTMLPSPQVATANVASAVPGTMYRCQPSGSGTITVTLPAPTLGDVVGMTLDSATGSCVLTHNSTELIYGVDTDSNGTRGATSITMTQPDTYVVVIADGANWREYGTVVSVPWSFFSTITSGSATSVTIPSSGSIVGGFSTIEIDITVRSQTGTAADNLFLRFNGDAGTNYSNETVFGQGTGAAGADNIAATASTVGGIVAGAAPANVFSHYRIVIPSYANTSFFKVYSAFGGAFTGSTASTQFVEITHGLWISTAAITSIVFTTQSSAAFANGTQVVARLLP